MTAIDTWIAIETVGVAVMLSLLALGIASLFPPPKPIPPVDSAGRLLPEEHAPDVRRIDLPAVWLTDDRCPEIWEMPPLIIAPGTNPRGMPIRIVRCRTCLDQGFLGGCVSCSRAGAE